MTTYFVRSAGRADLAAIGALLRETWHATYDAIYGVARVREITGSCHAVDALAARLRRPTSEFLVADDGSRLGGMGFAASGGVDGRAIVLHQLYVRPGAQGQGVGPMLLAEIEASFPGAERIRLEVESANMRAVAFFRKAGFAAVAPAGERADGSLGVPAMIYEKRLP